ncbi:MAG: phage tail assembly chaperone [Thiobacillus sp.]|jgi:tagatose-1,6-bisphosphate aldolase non-catalytic subunit AgaZ/GatZ|uniref:phage tail assembly chaperone n=1 Tax=Thiobacillus sp. TaxID=924 RepID=UPI00289427F2|nr:phage tail assembly chaperone [Thiobacillus sp.]MDT3708173.1 phage tail assembly chaperone [Thiobacillus sp.]
MLKLQPEPTFVASVVVPVPGGGDALINVTFRHKGRAALKEWTASFGGRDDADCLDEVIAAWDGVDVDYSRAQLGVLLDAYPGAAMALLNHYVGELGRAKAKN